jgi:signal transduction histidine kinase
LVLTVVSPTGTWSAEIIGRLPRVLILYPYDERIPATNIAGETARARLLEATQGKIDLFSEFLDLSRFPDDVHIDRMARYLSEKYVEHQPDVVVALGEESTRFISQNRHRIAPEAKIVFAGFSAETAAGLNLPDDVVGAFTEFDIGKTFEMAIRLQPNARRLVVIGGSSKFDEAWIANARVNLPAVTGGVETTYLTGLSIDEFVEHAARLSPDSILIVLTVFVDRSGRNFIPQASLEMIAEAAAAPTYGPYSTYVGRGVVGGNTVTFESMGSSVADLAIDVIAGKTISDVEVPHTYVADARQLERWGLSESALPAGTVQSFEESSIWADHWQAITGGIGVLAMQGLVIAGLLIERRKRQTAETQSQLHLLEAVHLNQSATAGALSASIAHELNQPLGAIRSNADAAEILLRSDTPDLKLIRQIVADIRDDDQRAGDIIMRLRAMLRKRSEIDWQEFDLNEAIGGALRILHAEAARRRVEVTSNYAATQLPVRADRVHIQQVILNLATNAMDAMLDVVSPERKLVFQTALTREAKVELSVSDTGCGIPGERLATVFEPFYTTKPTGTGLGLAIARTIIETYGGRIWADNRPEGGAVFRFNLPLAQGLQ